MIAARVPAKLLGACLASALPFALALPCAAQNLTATVGLDGAQETPPVVTGGSGTATVVVDPVTRVITVSGSYTGLSSGQTLAHVHVGTFHMGGGPIVTLSGTGATTGTFSGSGTLTPPQFTKLRNGGLYLNVHTVNNPTGEIRGQIVNIACPAQSPTDPVLTDSAGDPLRGPRINDATERYNVALDCSGAGAPGVYAILIHAGTLSLPGSTPYGYLWFSSTKLGSISGAHAQNVVSYAPGAGIVLPNSTALVGLSYDVQGYCSDPSAPPGRLSSALIQVVE